MAGTSSMPRTGFPNIHTLASRGLIRFQQFNVRKKGDVSHHAKKNMNIFMAGKKQTYDTKRRFFNNQPLSRKTPLTTL